MTGMMRDRLKRAASAIADHWGASPSGPYRAFSKLFIAPAWEGRGVRRPGISRWKAGELVEAWRARHSRSDLMEEVGDVGYYVAQTWTWLWRIYELVVPEHVIEAAVEKFEDRARGHRGQTEGVKENG